MISSPQSRSTVPHCRRSQRVRNRQFLADFAARIGASWRLPVSGAAGRVDAPVTCRPLPVRLSRAVWGVALRTRRRQATLVCLVALGLAAAVVVAGPAAGEPPAIAAKRAEAQRVLGEIQSLDSQLDRRDRGLQRGDRRSRRIEAERALNTRHLSIAKNNLVVAQRRLGDRIRAMYKQPQDDSTLAILLGSHSLTDFLDSVETANSVASQDTQVVGEIKKFKHDVTVRAAFLKKAQARQEQIVSQRAAAKQEIESGLAERQRLVESIKGEIAQARGRGAGAPGAARRGGAAAAPGPARPRRRRQRSRPSSPGRTSSAPPRSRRKACRSRPPSRFGGVVGIAMQYLGTPYVWGGSLARRLRLLRVRDVRLRAGRRLAAAPRGRPVQLRHARLARRARSRATSSSSTGSATSGSTSAAAQFIHAPHTGDVVKISSLSDSWYASTYVGAPRASRSAARRAARSRPRSAPARRGGAASASA